MKLLTLVLSIILLIISCNKVVTSTELTSDTSDGKPIVLFIDPKSQDSLTFTLQNNSHDTVYATPVGTNQSRLYFVINDEQTIEHYRAVSFMQIPGMPPNSIKSWTIDVNEIVTFHSIDTSANVRMYWKFNDFSSDTLRIK